MKELASRSHEVKFRIWDKRAERMNGWDWVKGSFIKIGEVFNSDLYTVMLYTGLEDKNDMPIYEGDIIKWFDFIGFVKFYKGSFALWDSFERSPKFTPHSKLIGYAQNGKIIGNKFENPELLDD